MSAPVNGRIAPPTALPSRVVALIGIRSPQRPQLVHWALRHDLAPHLYEVGDSVIDALAERPAALIAVDTPRAGPARRWCEALRERQVVAPILVLSANPHVEESALEAGADDFVHRDSPALIPRLDALYRRAAGVYTQVIACGPLELDRRARAVRVGGAPVRLTRIEHDLLARLLQARGRPLTLHEIQHEIIRAHGSGSAARRHVSNLKKKLGAAGRLIRTEWGVGYRIDWP